MYWEGSGEISKLKNNFLQESLLPQPIMILIIFFCNLKIFILSVECPTLIDHKSIKSGSRKSKSFSEYLLIHVV